MDHIGNVYLSNQQLGSLVNSTHKLQVGLSVSRSSICWHCALLHCMMLFKSTGPPLYFTKKQCTCMQIYLNEYSNPIQASFFKLSCFRVSLTPHTMWPIKIYTMNGPLSQWPACRLPALHQDGHTPQVALSPPGVHCQPL